MGEQGRASTAGFPDGFRSNNPEAASPARPLGGSARFRTTGFYSERERGMFTCLNFGYLASLDKTLHFSSERNAVSYIVQEPPVTRRSSFERSVEKEEVDG
jgi:hypothetical protein